MRRITMLIIVGVFGCSQQTVRGTHLKMRMFAPQQAVLLIVDGNGAIAFGGGHDALQDTTSWQGHMTSPQLMQFNELIASCDWLQADVQRANHIQGFEIRIKQGTVDNKFLLPLSDQAAVSMYDLLQSIAIARLEPTLNALPKPSMDTIIDRKVSGMDDQ